MFTFAFFLEKNTLPFKDCWKFYHRTGTSFSQNHQTQRAVDTLKDYLLNK